MEGYLLNRVDLDYRRGVIHMKGSKKGGKDAHNVELVKKGK